MRTELVDFPVVVYAELPEQLTAPLAEPPAPAANCTLHGQAAVCGEDGLLQIDVWRTTVQRCNVDRATARDITSGDALQPWVFGPRLGQRQSHPLSQAVHTFGDGEVPWSK